MNVDDLDSFLNEELALAEEALQWANSHKKNAARKAAVRIIQAEIEELKVRIAEVARVKKSYGA